jgi:hypothetical protein
LTGKREEEEMQQSPSLFSAPSLKEEEAPYIQQQLEQELQEHIVKRKRGRPRKDAPKLFVGGGGGAERQQLKKKPRPRKPAASSSEGCKPLPPPPPPKIHRPESPRSATIRMNLEKVSMEAKERERERVFFFPCSVRANFGAKKL